MAHKAAYGRNGDRGAGAVFHAETDVMKGCAESKENQIQVGFPAGDLLWKMGPATMVTARQQIAGSVSGVNGLSVKL